MTALMSLRSRLALSRVALLVPGADASPGFVGELAAAGVDLLVVGATGDEAADVEIVRSLRAVHGTSRLLIATDNGAAAEPAAADVIHIHSPGWRLWGHYPSGHRWSLLGRCARDARTVRSPGEVWDYLFIGPLQRVTADSRALSEALKEQTPFRQGALPWFAYGNFSTVEVDQLAGMGVRRIALTADAVAEGDVAGRVSAISSTLRAAWDEDPEAVAYRFAAAAL